MYSFLFLVSMSSARGDKECFLCVIFVFKGCLMVGSMTRISTEFVRVLKGCFKGVVRVFSEYSFSDSEGFQGSLKPPFFIRML